MAATPKSRTGVLRGVVNEKRPRARKVEHGGADLMRSQMELQCCDGAPNNEYRTKLVEGFTITGVMGHTIDLCPRCAVKLAVEILEQEVG